MRPGLKRFLNLSLIFGTLLIVLLIAFRDNSLEDAIRYVRSMSVSWIVISVLTYLAYLAMDSVAIHFFLRRQGYSVSIGRLAFISVIGQYYSNITPGASGGQPMQIYYLHKDGVPTAIATSAIVMRFFCFQVMLTLFAAYYWIMDGAYIMDHVGAMKWILIVGFCYNTVMVTGLAILALRADLIKKLIAFGMRLGRRWIRKPEETSDKLNRAVDVFHDSLASYKDSPLDMVVQLVIGGLQLLCMMSILFCVYRGLGLKGETYGHIIGMSVMEYISAAYAPLPGASGAQEGVFSMYFNQIFPDGMLIAALLLWRFFTYYICLVLGAVCVTVHGIRSGKSLKEVKQEEEAIMKAKELPADKGGQEDGRV